LRRHTLRACRVDRHSRYAGNGDHHRCRKCGDVGIASALQNLQDKDKLLTCFKMFSLQNHSNRQNFPRLQHVLREKFGASYHYRGVRIQFIHSFISPQSGSKKQNKNISPYPQRNARWRSSGLAKFVNTGEYSSIVTLCSVFLKLFIIYL